MKQRLMWVVWPAFLVAAVLEMVVFAFIDPEQVHSLGGEPLAASRQALYTIAFFIFWIATMASSALSLALAGLPAETEAGSNPQLR